MNISYSMICVYTPIAHTPMIKIYYIVKIRRKSTIEYINGVQCVYIYEDTSRRVQRAAFLLFTCMKQLVVEPSLGKPSVVVVVVFGTHYWTTYYISTKICCLSSIIVKFDCRMWAHEIPLIHPVHISHKISKHLQTYIHHNCYI